MAKYIDNGVDLVYINDKIHFKDPHNIENPCCIEIGENGFIFNKSGLYSVSISSNGTTVTTTVTNVTPQKQPCDGCKYYPKQSSEIERPVFYITDHCVCCSRRCTDHYEKEEK